MKARREDEVIGAWEVNFDGLVGPTHNYAGLSYGNLASMDRGGSPSNPKKAALQGLRKMRVLTELGLKQGVLPPQERPDVTTLRELGFTGRDDQVLERAAREAPILLAACTSVSSMWAANAATVSPAADTADGRVHLTPANLVSQFHRSLEPATTARVLRTIFPDRDQFVHHPPLPAGGHFSDEGAANHMRLCRGHGNAGVEVFVYGRSGFESQESGPRTFPARQTLEAAQALARRHRLFPDRAVCVRQNPRAIDAGVFHNDVIAVANEDVLFCHASSFADPRALDEMRRAFARCAEGEPVILVVSEEQLPLSEAVENYLFNSQLVTLPDGGMALIAPSECRGKERVREVLQRILAADNPVRTVRYVHVRQSMRNGGGPACLRLRVVLSEDNLAAVHPGVLLTESLHEELVRWVERHYRERLMPTDLGDRKLLDESRAALDELTRLLSLGSIYGFQRTGS